MDPFIILWYPGCFFFPWISTWRLRATLLGVSWGSFIWVKAPVLIHCVKYLHFREDTGSWERGCFCWESFKRLFPRDPSQGRISCQQRLSPQFPHRSGWGDLSRGCTFYNKGKMQPFQLPCFSFLVPQTKKRPKGFCLSPRKVSRFLWLVGSQMFRQGWALKPTFVPFLSVVYNLFIFSFSSTVSQYIYLEAGRSWTFWLT